MKSSIFAVITGAIVGLNFLVFATPLFKKEKGSLVFAQNDERQYVCAPSTEIGADEEQSDDVFFMGCGGIY